MTLMLMLFGIFVSLFFEHCNWSCCSELRCGFWEEITLAFIHFLQSKQFASIPWPFKRATRLFKSRAQLLQSAGLTFQYQPKLLQMLNTIMNTIYKKALSIVITFSKQWARPVKSGSKVAISFLHVNVCQIEGVRRRQEGRINDFLAAFSIPASLFPDNLWTMEAFSIHGEKNCPKQRSTKTRNAFHSYISFLRENLEMPSIFKI